jgi:RND family efflux transporter MFP subunit
VVAARANVTAVPEVSGRVTYVNENFYPGGQFTAGEVLFRLEPRDYQLTLNQREADLQRAEANLEITQAQVDSAIFDWRQSHGDKPVPTLVAKQPQLLQAKAEVTSAQAALDAAKLQLQRTEFSFPFAGKVLSSSVAPGQFLVAGQAYGQVFSAADLEISASLDEQQLQWLVNAKLPEISIRYSQFGVEHHLPGTLVRGAASLDTNTRFAQVNFAFLETNTSVIPGTFVDINIQGQQLNNVMQVPLSALQTDGKIWLTAKGELQQWNPEIIFKSAAEIIVQAPAGPIEVVTSRVAGGFSGMSVTTSDNNEVFANE